MNSSRLSEYTQCANCSGSGLVHGWVSQPSARGTTDIIWSCTSTIFICVWVMLHLNVPGVNDTGLVIVARKTKWFILAMLAPELVLLFAGGQWAAAHRSVTDMTSIQAENWTMVHAMYAEAGGFMLQPQHGPSFPVTARQIFYLVSKKYIPAPTISRQEIWDKSKADRFAKLAAVLQGGWFTSQIIARVAQGLEISLLELSTLCLMTCTVATLFFWFHKPLDVRMPTYLHLHASIAQLLFEAGESGKKHWKDTPLDFVEPLEYTSSQFPLNRFWGEQQRPLPRIPNDRDSLLHNGKVLVAIGIPTAAFGVLQLIAWNFEFPTRHEQLMWRYTCLANAVVLGVGAILEAANIVASNYKLSGLCTFNNYKTRWPWCLSFYIAGAMYVTARVVVIVEVLVSLRALPASCFVNIEWTNLLPHV